MIVIQFAGQTNCTGTNNQATIVPGVDTPSTADTWAPFLPYNGDQNITNYKIVGGVLIYIPTNTQVPDVLGLKTQIVTDFAEGLLPAPAYLELDQFSGTLADLSGNLPALQASWAALKAVFAAPGQPLSGTYPDSTPITTKIESYSVTYGVPLIASS